MKLSQIMNQIELNRGTGNTTALIKAVNETAGILVVVDKMQARSLESKMTNGSVMTLHEFEIRIGFETLRTVFFDNSAVMLILTKFAKCRCKIAEVLMLLSGENE